MDWQSLGSALALVFIIEGILPFISPQAARNAYARLATADPRVFRIVGLISIASGLSLLALIRG